MNSKINVSSDKQVMAERQWKAIDTLIETERTTLEDLSRVWNKPLSQLLRWKEEKKLLPYALEHNLVLRFGVSPIWIWLGEEPILIKTENPEWND